MDIMQFMQGYKTAWEQRDDALFCALFTADGQYPRVRHQIARIAEFSAAVRMKSTS
jgi:hypothetical protein